MGIQSIKQVTLGRIGREIAYQGAFSSLSTELFDLG
jgi:hypothetical protein